MYEKMLIRHQELEAEIDSLNRKISDLPEGKLLCARNQNYWKWYQSDGSTHVYLPKEKRTLAEKLAVKKYLTQKSEELVREKRAVEFYLRHYPQTMQRASEQLLCHPGYAELLEPYFKALSDELKEWRNAPYDRNTNFPEHLIHRASSGNTVRSKSEALIDMILYSNQIPFRYECALELGGIVIYPDYTIRHPKTGTITYWEHFGKMDDKNYCRSVYTKLQLYINNGIIPTFQLITTYEDKNHPLAVEVVEKIVKDYFL